MKGTMASIVAAGFLCVLANSANASIMTFGDGPGFTTTNGYTESGMTITTNSNVDAIANWDNSN